MRPAAAELASASLAELADAARAKARSADGVLSLLAIGQRYDWETPEAVHAALAELATDKRLPAPSQVLVKRLLAQATERLGDLAAADTLYAELGYLTEFRVVGPFDNEGKVGLDHETEPERDRLLAPDMEAGYEGKERPVHWRVVPPEIVRRGLVPFSYLLRPSESVCAVAETFVKSEEETTLSLWFGAGGASKVYWNGQEVMRDERYRAAPAAERNAVWVQAQRGWNRLLIKECVQEQPLGFYVRLGDRSGRPQPDLEVSSSIAEALDIAEPELDLDGDDAAGEVPLAFLDGLWRAAEEPGRPASVLVDLARYLHMTRSDDAAVKLSHELVEAAVGDGAKARVDQLLLAVDLAEQRGEKMRYARLALARFPTHPAVLMMQAELLASGPAPEDALPAIARIPRGGLPYLRGQRLKAAIFNDLGLPGAAYRVLSDLRARYGDRPAVLRGLAAAADAASHTDEAVAVRDALLQVRHDDMAARRALIADALRQGAVARAGEHLDVLRRLAPGSPSNLRYLARAHDAIGRDDLSLATYRDAMGYLPESAPLRFEYARALLRASQVQLAAEALSEVLRLSPQHARARELLRYLQPRERRDEGYAVDTETFLSRRTDGAGHSVTTLHQLQVNTVFDNGLGTRFTQLVAQAHDDEGARNLRVHSIPFDPDTQRVDLRLARVYRPDGRELSSIRVFEQQLGEPWYRIYYDSRALTVVFPDLSAGDVVELRYRVDDIAHRNRFADYFGDLHPLADFSPTIMHEYVLITPKDRKFYTNQPIMPGLTKATRVAGSRRIQRWTASDVPALIAEGDMPGLTEVSPYLHVSTYRTWDEVGSWYWGLIRDQLYADQFLKDTVAELVSDQGTLEQKVRAIHRWVLDHTRYVGLEFGIHGYQPYRVPLVAQRGFGDCKDKAALLYTMFREAGIESRIVLVRTRRNGEISELPASLAVFDHAIAYVPQLDLYIDGTAEHSGIRELPPQDQGVTVLLVGPDGASLRKTPVLDPDARERTKALRVSLLADGSARVSAEETIDGTAAAGYRSRYEAPGTRQERFTRSLAEQYPGVEVRSLSFTDLTDLDAPVKYDYSITVPSFAERDGQVLRVAPSSLGNLVRRMARTPSRVHPLDLSTRSAYREARLITAPEGYAARDLPRGGEVTSPFFKLSLRVVRQEAAILAETALIVRKDRIPPDDYSEFRDRIQEADRLLRQRIGFGKVEP